MFKTERTSEFDKWIRKLKDIRAKAKILFRIQKLETADILVIVNPLETELTKCGLITLRAIEFTLRK